MSIFAVLGVPTLINARGTATKIGSSRLSPAVRAAMDEAAQAFVNMDLLQARAGALIARMTGTEAALVTPGAAAGIALAVAACITGGDRALMRRLPDVPRGKNEVIIQRGHRNDYDQAVLQAGGRLVEAGYVYRTEPFEIEEAIGERTAAVLFVDHMRGAQLGMVRLPQVVEIAHRHGVPVIVDAATKLPPVSNLRDIPASGADLVTFSGGKAIQGPSASGFICGRAGLVAAAAAQSSPNSGIGRSMKVGKEEIAGLVAALHEYVARNHAAIEQVWEQRIRYIQEQVAGVAGCTAERIYPDECGRPIPRLKISLAGQDGEARALKAIDDMAGGAPAIAVANYLADGGIIIIDPTCLRDGEEQAVGRRLCDVLQSV